MRSVFYRKFTVIAAALAMIAAIGIATLTHSAVPRRPRRVARRHRPRAARRPWRRKLAKRPKVVRKVPRLKVVTVPTGGVVVTNGTTSETVETTETTGETETSKTTKEATPVDTSSHFANETSYAVKKLESDGFTAVIDVDGAETKVRLIGIAPIQFGKKPAAGKRPGGKHNRPPRGANNRPAVTTMFMNNLLSGESVYVVYDSRVKDEDEDGNYVGYLYRAPDGLLINLEAVRQGFCAVDNSYDFDEKQTFEYYQKKARKYGKGIWGRRNRNRQKRPLRRPEGRTSMKKEGVGD